QRDHQRRHLRTDRDRLRRLAVADVVELDLVLPERDVVQEKTRVCVRLRWRCATRGRAPVERVGCQLVALPTRDADPGVDSRTARLEYDEGVDVQLLDVRMLADQPGYALNHV